MADAEYEWSPDDIASLRRRFDLTQAEFAKVLDIKRRAMARLETGVSVPAKGRKAIFDLLQRLANEQGLAEEAGSEQEAVPQLTRDRWVPPSWPAFYLEYWTAFKQFVETSEDRWPRVRPSGKSYVDYPIGVTGFRLSSALWPTGVRAGWREHGVGAIFVVAGTRNPETGEPDKSDFDRLVAHRNEIDSLVSQRCKNGSLEWLRKDNTNVSYIFFANDDAEPTDRASWNDQFLWLKNGLDCLLNVFGPYIR